MVPAHQQSQNQTAPSKLLKWQSPIFWGGGRVGWGSFDYNCESKTAKMTKSHIFCWGGGAVFDSDPESKTAKLGKFHIFLEGGGGGLWFDCDPEYRAAKMAKSHIFRGGGGGGRVLCWPYSQNLMPPRYKWSPLQYVQAVTIIIFIH